MSRIYKKKKCFYCEKFVSVTNIKRHEASCKINPHKNSSYFDKWRHSFHSNKEKHKPMGGAIQTPQGLKRLSEIASSRCLGGHTSKKRIFFERKNGDVVYLQSSYEIEFASILENLNIEWSRPDPLIWFDGNGKKHRYYPDFKIGDIYIDTKNDYLVIKDLPKITAVIEQNKIDLRIITKKDITKEFIASLV